MTEHQVRIALPVATVHQAWHRYVGYGGSQAGDGDLAWHAEDGSGLTATFVSDGPGATILITGRDADSPVPPHATAVSLDELADGFVAYVDAAFAELNATPGDTQGDAPVGPDGTAHMPQQPSGLGTDSALANVTAARHGEQTTLGG